MRCARLHCLLRGLCFFGCLVAMQGLQGCEHVTLCGMMCALVLKFCVTGAEGQAPGRPHCDMIFTCTLDADVPLLETTTYFVH